MQHQTLAIGHSRPATLVGTPDAAHRNDDFDPEEEILDDDPDDNFDDLDEEEFGIDDEDFDKDEVEDDLDDEGFDDDLGLGDSDLADDLDPEDDF